MQRGRWATRRSSKEIVSAPGAFQLITVVFRAVSDDNNDDKESKSSVVDDDDNKISDDDDDDDDNDDVVVLSSTRAGTTTTATTTTTSTTSSAVPASATPARYVVRMCAGVMRVVQRAASGLRARLGERQHVDVARALDRAGQRCARRAQAERTDTHKRRCECVGHDDSDTRDRDDDDDEHCSSTGACCVAC
jgi:hypothetical protein